MTLDGFLQSQEQRLRYNLARFYPRPTPVLPEGDVALHCGTEYAWDYGCRCEQCKRGYQQRRMRRVRAEMRDQINAARRQRRQAMKVAQMTLRFSHES